MTPPIVVDPLLAPDDADQLVRLWHDFPSYGLYSNEGSATAIAYFGSGRGGELAYYPDGPEAPAATYGPRHNTAVVLDTDSVFHGVDRVAGDDTSLASIRPGMRLHHDADDRWSVRDGATEV